MANVLRCPHCQKQTMTLAHESEYGRLYKCLICGKEFWPMRLSASDLHIIEKATKAAERRDQQEYERRLEARREREANKN